MCVSQASIRYLFFFLLSQQLSSNPVFLVCLSVTEQQHKQNKILSFRNIAKCPHPHPHPLGIHCSEYIFLLFFYYQIVNHENGCRTACLGSTWRTGHVPRPTVMGFCISSQFFSFSGKKRSSKRSKIVVARLLKKKLLCSQRHAY